MLVWSSARCCTISALTLQVLDLIAQYLALSMPTCYSSYSDNSCPVILLDMWVLDSRVYASSKKAKPGHVLRANGQGLLIYIRIIAAGSWYA